MSLELSFMKLNNPDQAIKYNLTLSELLLLLAFSLFDKKLCCLYMIHYKQLQICHFVIWGTKTEIILLDLKEEGSRIEL